MSKKGIEARREPNSEKRLAPEIEKSKPKPTVLSLSEMALYAKGPDGEKIKIAEVGNSNYPFKERFVEFLPGVGFQINFGRQHFNFEEDTLFKVPHSLGFVTARQFFGSEELTWSERDFEIRLYDFCRLTEKKMRVLTSFALAAGWQVNRDFFEVGGYDYLMRRIVFLLQAEAGTAGEKSSFYPSPEEIIRRSVDIILEDNQDKVDEEKQMFKKLCNRPFVTARNQEEFRAATVDLFYLWATLNKRFDLGTRPEQTKEAVLQYPFVEELIEQFNHRTGPEWGDALLSACSEISLEWKAEDEVEKNKDAFYDWAEKQGYNLEDSPEKIEKALGEYRNLENLLIIFRRYSYLDWGSLKEPLFRLAYPHSEE
jgi:hypothetical protein